MKIIVLGAGLIGTTSAWYLNRSGHDVHVLERRINVAQETSFANGGQISVSHAEPWANPSAPFKIFKWICREDAPLLFRLRAEPFFWRWVAHFTRECTPKRTARNIRQIIALSDYSRQCLKTLRTEIGIVYEHLERGILHFYTQEKCFAHARRTAHLMNEFGCHRKILTPDQTFQIEPALKSLEGKLVGADFTAEDESGNAHLFTRQLADFALHAGVQFHFNMQVIRLHSEGSGSTSRISSVELIDPQGFRKMLSADLFVVASGCSSVQLIKSLGLHPLIYPGKGYSATFPIIDSNRAPFVSLTDDENALVFSRLGEYLRVAGTCEIAGEDLSLNPIRCEALTKRARALFPKVCDYDAPQYWSGLRPMTPSNRPYIGQTRYSNLYLNCGHGTLGWTMACGSGKALSDLINQQTPEVNYPWLRGTSLNM